jgi:type I restriction enzyme R subunit
MTDDLLFYLTPEARARVRIDEMLTAAGWAVQDGKQVNFAAARGVAIREFVLQPPHGRADYLLFVDRVPVGVLEAKKEGETLTGVEWQSAKYRDGLPNWVNPGPEAFMAFYYESTGVETRFTSALDPDPRSRQVFWFHRPDTLASWAAAVAMEGETTLRHLLRSLPELDDTALWPAQARAILNLEESLADNRPRALIQMATGAGKTFTAANVAYRLIKFAGARRVLFLVDRANLGRQTLKEFQAFTTPDDGRKFTALYNVQHLSSNVIDPVARVTITTIQRLYSILKGETELDPELDEHPPMTCCRQSRCRSTTTRRCRSRRSIS